MTEEEKKAWEELIQELNDPECRSGYPLDERGRCVLAAAAELTRLRAIVQRVEDVERMARELAGPVKWTRDEIERDYWRVKARAVRTYIRGEGE